MKHSTAIKIANKLLDNKETVKLRKSKHGGVSSVTWCHICEAFFYKGYDKIGYTMQHDKIVLTANGNFISDKIVLF